jgi:hypothetical protein
VPNQQAPVEQRTCPTCGRKFRSIRKRQIHEAEAHGAAVEVRVYKKATTVNLLRAIVERQRTLTTVRGPRATELAKALGVSPIAVRAKLEEAESRGFVTGDLDAGFIVTPTGAYAAFNMKED